MECILNLFEFMPKQRIPNNESIATHGHCQSSSIMKNKHIILSLTRLSLAATSAHFSVVVGAGFTGRTFSGNVVTVTDYTLDGVASPGLTFNGPTAFMTSSEAADKAMPIRNAPNWDVLIPVNVMGSNLDLTNGSITFEAFGNSQLSKTNISGGYSPNYQPKYKRLGKWWGEMKRTGGKIPPGQKKKMVVAIARKFQIDLWRINTGRTTCEQLGLEMLS